MAAVDVCWSCHEVFDPPRAVGVDCMRCGAFWARLTSQSAVDFAASIEPLTLNVEDGSTLSIENIDLAALPDQPPAPPADQPPASEQADIMTQCRVEGRGFHSPVIQIDTYSNRVCVRVDDDLNPEAWVEFWFSAEFLAVLTENVRNANTEPGDEE